MQAKPRKTTAIGINHVALEVGDIDEALAFYGELFNFKLRGRKDKMAFIDLGDQYLALTEGRSQEPDTKRHFGLVVDDREAMRPLVQRLGCTILSSPFPSGLDFLDPWGNYIQVVEYASVQFTKSPEVLAGMGLPGLHKDDQVLKELKEKGMEPPQNS
ncbi:VOC family protein [Geoalkalibacter halelectricus]|uniref:VOC family protein n=1 Tax=Geoalkalibacter halelectricus TaxID=2847045 RepID=A0ABY5ZGA1_9BACT|nr:VOC family protein [Geoalkalibacter halelectricus]MDO3380236.1 VOC family protein [Geoalkalibacter halelectricus]UWZ78195.1 VOC family protein [Geoalkalibacter halelectricus]